jgi:lipopolysaccharide transport system ATP-binding protein
MSDIAIRAERISKLYRLGKRQRYRTLRDTITDTFSAMFRRSGSSASSSDHTSTFWALKDVSFEVKQGEVIGIIGRNGAGKSTLLKILSRITEPTEGIVRIHGRVGSLLEVGTGFHPELSGRENIYLNGAILGMTRDEIQNNLDDIVAFAEVEEFIDTPVKHYSSGMYLRLAFAVAAHLEPEILIVDEVLAVGDAAFQKKCLGKMGEISKQGRTVLFVSHNMVAVENLCSRAILVDKGHIALEGPAREVIGQYLRSNTKMAGYEQFAKARQSIHPTPVELVGCEILASSADGFVRAGETFTVRTHFSARERITHPVFALALYSNMGVPLFAVHTSDLDVEIPEIHGPGFVDIEIESPNLMPGNYLLHFAVGDELDPHKYDHRIDAAELVIESADIYQSGRLSSAGWTLVYFRCNCHVKLGCDDFSKREALVKSARELL